MQPGKSSSWTSEGTGLSPPRGSCGAGGGGEYPCPERWQLIALRLRAGTWTRCGDKFRLETKRLWLFGVKWMWRFSSSSSGCRSLLRLRPAPAAAWQSLCVVTPDCDGVEPCSPSAPSPFPVVEPQSHPGTPVFCRAVGGREGTGPHSLP